MTVNDAMTKQARRYRAWLPRLADPAHAVEAGQALWEIEMSCARGASDEGSDALTREETDARALAVYAPALDALAGELDDLIPAWVARFLERLRLADRNQQQRSAAIEAGDEDLPPIDMAEILAMGQLEKALQAVGDRIDPHVGPLVDAIGTVGRDGDEHLAAVLERVGPGAATDAAPKLLGMLRERGIWCWPSHLSRALANAARSDDRVVPALRQMLSDGDEDVRKAAIEVLGAVGPAGREASDELLAFRGGTEDEQCRIIQALSLQGDPTPAYIEVLDAAMRDANGYVRRAAANALGEVTPDPERFVPMLIEACDWPEFLHDESLPEAAVGALGRYGPAARAALPRLTTFVSGPIKGRTVKRDEVLDAIEAIDSDAAEALRRAVAPAARPTPVGGDEPLFAVPYQGKQCYVDRDGRLALVTRFEYGGPFVGDRAIVHDDDGGTFVIDRAGREVFRSTWDDIKPFAEGLAAVSRDDKWGFVDADGRVVVEPQYDGVTPFAEGLAGFEVGRRPIGDPNGLSSAVSGKQGFIDRGGNVVIPATWAGVSTFREGLAVACTGGTMKPNPFWDNEEMLTDRKYGYIDRAGNLVIDGRYALAYPFSEGLAVVVAGAAWGRARYGYIDARGNPVVPLKLTSATPLKDGLAVVRPRGRRHRESHVVIDRTGRTVAELKFGMVEPFSEGLAAAWDGEAFGFVDPEGRWVVEPQFDQCEQCVNGLAEVQRGDWYGLIDRTGRFVWGPTTEGNVGRVIESEWT